MFSILIILLFLPLMSGQAADIYYSEDELYEAYLKGEIDYNTYMILVEIIENGIDSTELHLLEELPDVSFFQRVFPEIFSSVETDQKNNFMTEDRKPDTDKINGYLKVYNTLKLEEDGQYKNYYYLKSDMPGGWTTDVKISRDYDGTFEWSKRTLTHEFKRSNLKKIILGSFNARFGLGLSIGYRGTFLVKDMSFADQTAIFPDYGGYNGIYMESGRRSDGVKILGHYDKNGTHQFGLAALDIRKKYRGLSWEGILSGGILKNRESGVEFKYYQLGTYLKYRYHDYEAAVEAAFPDYASSVIPAVVFESSYSEYPIRLRFSGWHYSDDYYNFTGGDDPVRIRGRSRLTLLTSSTATAGTTSAGCFFAGSLICRGIFCMIYLYRYMATTGSSILCG